jgi:ribosomal protein S12 methylthiotransferase accessory factor
LTRAGAARPIRPRAVRELPWANDSAAVHVCLALPPRRVGAVSLKSWWSGFGSGLTRREARRRAAAEIIERASAVFQGDEPERRASWRELGGAGIHPDRFLLFSDRQRRAPSPSRSPILRVPPPLPPDLRIRWTEVRSLSSGDRRYLPSAAVYFKHPAVRSRRYCPVDSSGLAAGPSRAAATLGGLLELVERDGVALWWYNRIPRPELPVGPDPILARLHRFYRRISRETWLLDLTSDLGIPTCAAVSVARDSGRGLAFGFGAGLTRERAARHALLEMAQPLAARRAGWRGGEGTGPFERWRRRMEGAGLPPWLRPSRNSPAPLARGLAPGSVRASLARCCAAVERAGLEVLACDLTRPGSRLAVVRVLVPGLRHFWPRLAPGRLYTAPVQAGWLPAARSEPELNPTPLLG